MTETIPKIDQQRTPSLEMPASMLQKLLEQGDKIGSSLSLSVATLQEKKHEFRSQLKSNRIILDDSEIECDKSYSTCAIDGACASDRLMAIDMIVAGAVGVEGLAINKPSHWSDPDHDVFSCAEVHDDENLNIARALMLQMEWKLAANAPHDLILIDGSLTTALIHMYKAIDLFGEGNRQSRESVNKLRYDYQEFALSYKKILGLENTDKIWIGIPKYTSRNDIASSLNWQTPFDDKAILSLVLNPGEFTRPLLFTHKEAWRVQVPYEDHRLRYLMQEVIDGVKQLHFLYYKPYDWSPALRIEVPHNIVKNRVKLNGILEAVKTQCKIPSLLEPYPLYIADRIAKSVGQGIPSYRQIVTRRMVEEKRINPDDLFFIMHSYRTESNGS
jgi:hypothetical protein